ncbi:hypothetical protein MNBD_GAMMA01-1255 [hydrothermal vent metagenome]|uniref:Molybdenum transport ATP-binding protein ModC (TC 3.A.1.8.1) n=1 Tax=hydrothermal vent metagenome TaxID=652676 RepID=A0A3B0UPD9_9ZZZZ
MRVNITSVNPRYDYKFSVANSGVVGIYGISGSGKSSLLRAIAGYQNSVRGRIEFQQKFLLNTKDKQFAKVFKCSYMSQHPILFPHWSVADNLKFVQTHSNNSQSSEQTCKDLLQKLGCQHLLDKLPAQLSGGEKQRIAFILALIQIDNHTIVLLDEPFSALDTKLRKIALNLLDSYKQGSLIFLVTHEISELYQIADELIYIENGSISYHNSIQMAMASTHKDLPLASNISLAGIAHVIYADDVSICLNKNSDSSIMHQLDSVIKTIKIVGNTVIINLLVNSLDNRQYLYAKITKDSLQRLKLKPNQKVVANFKATSYQD